MNRGRFHSQVSAALRLLAGGCVCLLAAWLALAACVTVAGFTGFSSPALAQDADDDDDDDDGDGDDDDDDGGGGPGPGDGDPAADAADVSSEDDGVNFGPDDCFEDAMLRPAWLRRCEDRPVISVAPTAPPAPPRVTNVGAQLAPPSAVLRPEPPNALPREIVLVRATLDQIGQLTARGFTVVSRTSSGLGEVVRLRVPGDLSTAEGLELARQVAPGAIADYNHIYRPAQAACTTAACRQRRAIQWPSADCVVEAFMGIVDTAIDLESPALSGQKIEVIDGVSGGRAMGSSSHGTAIAALLAGRADGAVPGLLPKSRLIAIQAFHRSPSGEDIADTFDVVAAIGTALQRSVPVVNLSFTGPHNRVLFEAVQDATKKGTILVAAAGNLGPGGPVVYPAGFENVVAVTAVGDDLRVYRGANRGAYIDFAAPGVNVEVVAQPVATRFESGTSFAAPFITAALAAKRARQPAQSARELVDRLQSAATDLGKPGRDAVFGWGLVQVPSEVCQ